MRNRKNPTFQTRSPLIIVVGFSGMCLDCVLQTIWLTQPTHQSQQFKKQCDISILLTVFLTFGIMSIYIVRMWRVFKVFSLYQ
jgi:hypothetical protein